MHLKGQLYPVLVRWTVIFARRKGCTRCGSILRIVGGRAYFILIPRVGITDGEIEWCFLSMSLPMISAVCSQ
eukprot:1391554-Pleurochrysis_carterae.AAC.1